MYEINEMMGEIRHEERIKQVISFAGIKRRRNIRPMDIDGLIDYNGRSFVYFEGKLIDREIDRGQKSALENAVNSHAKAGHHACAVIFRHNVPVNEIVVAAVHPVSDIYYLSKWRPPAVPMNLLEFIEKWETQMEKLNVKL